MVEDGIEDLSVENKGCLKEGVEVWSLEGEC